jgi:hypothetical protein
VAAALAGLAVAGAGGQTLQPKPAEAAQKTIDSNGVSLHLAGEWRSMKSVTRLPAFRLRSPAAARRGLLRVVAGRAPSAGPLLIAKRARASLPSTAHEPRPVLVDGRAALRYGPATVFGGEGVEVLAMPLEDKVLLVHCSGPTRALSKVCAQASADLELRRGSPRPLAPTESMAGRLRAAAHQLDAERRRQRSLLASAQSLGKLSTAAENLARANHSFANSVAALPTTAQDAKSLDAAVRAARETEAAYDDLARADTDSAWSAARTGVDRSERLLATAIQRLESLRVYGD